ncbi:WD-repeat protein [Calothrix sp. NIES-4071]|nr:WD-repeat protein [Calothrix sp. NIES-4071]BAZ59784.1 WD-repeat protein [Calothrix sp. NIES-4105]
MNNIYQPEDIGAENEKSLKTLARTIRLSQGQFSLVLLRCNYSELQQRMTARLHQISPINISELSLQPSVKTLYTTILEDIGDEAPSALMVSGLNSVEDLDNLLTSANQVREEFRKSFAFPLLVWVDDLVLQKFIKLATDLENWATVIQFNSTTSELVTLLRDTTDDMFAGNIPNIQTCCEIESARQDLQRRRSLVEGADEASLQFILGYRAYLHEQMDTCLEFYNQSLSYWEETHYLERQGILQVCIASSYELKAEKNQLDYIKYIDESRNHLQNALNCFEQAQRLDLVVKYITKLGDVLRSLQAWDDLESLAQKALVLHQEHGTSMQIARNYGFLAEVALAKLQWKDAISLAGQALKALSGKDNDSYYRSLYKFIIARAQQNLGNIVEAIKHLEKIRAVNKPEYNPQLYISILETLRALYFEEGNYLEAFRIKQEQIAIEHQYSLRAFIGATYLHPKRHCTTKKQQAIVAQEIAAAGRQKDVDNLIERISRNDHKLTIIHGQSGVGKSSILKAGLIPALKQKSIGERDVLPIVVRVYTDWIGNLCNHFSDDIDNSIEAITEQLHKNADNNLLTVLIFDQFEEFFFVYNNKKQRQSFYEFIGTCLDINFVKIIFSLREDYLHYLLDLNRTINLGAINNNILDKNIRYHLGRFSPEEAKAVVESLTEQAKLYLEAQLIDELVKDLACEYDEVSPIELQIVGAQLQAEKITTLEQYRQLGTKNKLVERFLEQVIKDCGTDNERCAKLILYMLTNDNGTRPLKTRSELEADLKTFDLISDIEIDLVLEVLVGSGLVLEVREIPANRYQLVHDYLVRFIRQQQAPELLAALTAAREKQKLTEEQLIQALKEKEKALFKEQQERRRAEIAEIEALVSLSQALFVTHDQLGALVASLKAGIQIQQIDVPSSTKKRTVDRIRQVITEVQERNRLEGHSNWVTNVSLSNNGRTIATASANRNIMVWNLDGTLLNILQGHGDIVWSVCFSPNGNKIASASADNTVKVWSVDGTLLYTLKGHTDQVFGVCFSPSGNVIVSASADKTIKFWSIKGTLLQTLHGHTDQVFSVCFSPDASMVASAGADKTIRLWSTEDINTKLIKTLTGHTCSVNSVVFSPDRKTIISAGADHTIRLWSKSGNLLKTLHGHTASVNSVSVSPDGKIVSGSSDYTVKLWSKNGQLLKSLQGHNGEVNGVCFNSDRNLIISASADRTARIWSAKPPKPKSLELDELVACGRDWTRDYLTTNPNVRQTDYIL